MPSVYFQTFGCQMNVADSDALLSALAKRGYSPATTVDQADLVVVNTCSVREHAEARARARLAEIAAIKAKRPGTRLWVIGCMAERLGDKLKEAIPAIDLVIGAPELVDPEEIVSRFLDDAEFGEAVHLALKVSEFVPVIRGCDNFCAYCIVPFVRGRERSIPAEELLQTIRKRIETGVTEVTLLGQNVNSYNDHGLDFADLLGRIAELDGLERIRFMTSHPKDCTEKLLKTVAATPKVCPHLHLPVQSGSDRILALMNRRYTADHYRLLVAMIRGVLPDADITTDLLVGFPGETEEEFGATLALVEEVRFTSAFMFAYSVRTGTSAAKLPDDVPQSQKLERLNRLIKLQTEITRECYAAMVGRSLSMMVYGELEKRGERYARGQDRGCKRVLVPGAVIEAGTILPVRVVRSTGMTLIARKE